MRARARNLLAALGCAMAGAAQSAPPEQGFGINLHGIRYWSPAIPFADVFTQSGEWTPQRKGSPAWNTGEQLDIGPSGWIRSLAPGQEAATVVMAGGRYPPGQYLVAYEGKGELFLGLDATIAEKREQSLLVNVRPESSVLLKILRTDGADPIRNIRMYLPGVSADAPPLFNATYLDYVRGFKVIRFMDWANANLEQSASWGTRTLPRHASQARTEGAALEYMLEFARQAGAVPWLNVPYSADDNYVGRMAALLRESLGGGRFYLEYSNEVWNSIFPQHRYAVREAARRSLPDADAFYVRRSLEIFAIFEREFGGSAQFVRVLAGQAVNLWRGRKLLEHPGVGGAVDAYAIAPYFADPQRLFDAARDGKGAGTDEALLDVLEASIGEAREVMRANVALASRAGLPLIAYEGGQHVTNPPGQDRFCARLNRHPRMERLYERYLDAWMRETGGNLMVLFADMSPYGQSGCWGLAEYHGQPASQTPKLRAVRARVGAR